MVSIPHVKEEQWVFALQFFLDQNGLPHLDKATINEVYYEDAPVKPTTTTAPPSTTENKEGVKAEPEEKKVEKIKKERSTVCIIKIVECFFGLHQSILDSTTQKEASQETEDRSLNQAINKRNEIENFIYSTRSKLDGDMGQFVSSEEKETLLSLMQKMEDWLYSGDEEVYNKTVLEAKGKDLGELGSKISKRYHDWSKLSESYEKLESCINLNIKKLNQVTPQTSFLTQGDREEIQKNIVNYNNILNEGRIQYTKFPKLGDPPARYEDVDKASEELVKVRIINFKIFI